MTGFEKHVASDRDGWREPLLEFARVRKAQQAAAVGNWRGLFFGFAGVRNALQVAVGEPSASRSAFNVFEVTRRRGFEVTTHSALLCDLLNPRGSHGQGGAFLKAFLEILDGQHPPDVVRPPWPPADGWWSVAAERPAGEGRFDIVLTNRGPSGPATIAIENKWDHSLGDGQLERYGEHLAKLGPSGQSHRKCLVYLTRSGEDPQISLCVDFVVLSHSAHILRFLQSTLETLQDTAPPALREPLLQYCMTLDDDDG